VGKHHESGQGFILVRSKAFGRSLFWSFFGVLMLLVFGAQGPLPMAPFQAQPASGNVGPYLLDGGPPPSLAVGADAILSFERSTVETVAKSGKRHLNVASQDLDRPGKGKLYAPLEHLVPTSPFGLRIDPLSGKPGEFHWGQDFAAPCGTRVYTADAGVVRAVGWHLWGGGNRVEIDHGNGLITTYNHLQGIGVKKGQSVKVGQVIAKVGTTGSSTGCHLHFETIVNGVHSDPAAWTLIPIRQADPLDNIPMVNYAPGAGSTVTEAPNWAVPVAAAPEREVIGGEQEARVTPAPTASATPTPTSASTQTASQSPTATPSSTSTQTSTDTATATPTSTGTATPTQTQTSTATPTPTQTQTATPTPTPTPTLSPSPTLAPAPAPTETPAPLPPLTTAPTETPAPLPTLTETPVPTSPLPGSTTQQLSPSPSESLPESTVPAP